MEQRDPAAVLKDGCTARLLVDSTGDLKQELLYQDSAGYLVLKLHTGASSTDRDELLLYALGCAVRQLDCY